MYEQPKPLSNRALEMIMRDVLDGMQELALESALESGSRGCRILSIDPSAARPQRSQPLHGPAQVVELRHYRRAICG